MNRKTVLISGAGIAGPTLAFWLEAADFAPTLIEEAPALRTAGYVIDFWGLGYEIATRMGLEERIQRVGYHMRELRIVDYRGKRLAGFGTKIFGELTGGHFVTLGRSDLSRLLYETIQQSVETVFGDEIVGLEDCADSVRVCFARGDERQFDLVIGADGLHSKVRELAFGPQDHFEKQLGYTVAAFEVRGYRPRNEEVYVIYGEPGRMLARFALHDDRTLFLFVFTTPIEAAPQPLDTRAQKQILRERFGREDKWECRRILDELDSAQELYFDLVSQIRMPSWSRGRVALVGDAAFCVSLLAGQGSALAMTSAYVLAGELTRAGGRHEEAFAKYDALLRSYVLAKQRAAEGFANAFAPKTRFGLFFRNQVIKVAAIPGLARYALGRGIIDTLRLPDYRWPCPRTVRT
ncbi:MAG: FAD-binding domain [Proteobacteria bacterium]|nr:FAD-binding domain [Pseudomonadota bacterium]